MAEESASAVWRGPAAPQAAPTTSACLPAAFSTACRSATSSAKVLGRSQLPLGAYPRRAYTHTSKPSSSGTIGAKESSPPEDGCTSTSCVPDPYRRIASFVPSPEVTQSSTPSACHQASGWSPDYSIQGSWSNPQGEPLSGSQQLQLGTAGGSSRIGRPEACPGTGRYAARFLSSSALHQSGDQPPGRRDTQAFRRPRTTRTGAIS